MGELQLENIDLLEEKELAIVKTLYDWIRRKQDHLKSKYGDDCYAAAGILLPAMMRYARWRGSTCPHGTVSTAIHYWMLSIEPEHGCTYGGVGLAVLLDGFERHLQAEKRRGVCWICGRRTCDC